MQCLGNLTELEPNFILLAWDTDDIDQYVYKQFVSYIMALTRLLVYGLVSY